VIVGGHYDTRAGLEATANDASAMAVLLSLARRFKAKPTERTLHFVAYALSQYPHAGTDDMGSRRHAQRLVADGVRVTLALSLENMGHFVLTPGSQKTVAGISPALPETGHFTALLALPGAEQEAERVAGHLVTDEVVPLLLRSVAEPDGGSDAAEYRSVGLPAFQLSDLGASRAAPGAPSARGSIDSTRLARLVTHLEGTLRAALDAE
jgi:hypothetical protein